MERLEIRGGPAEEKIEGFSKSINGKYFLRDMTVNGLPLWKQCGQADVWLFYYPPKRMWVVTPR